MIFSHSPSSVSAMLWMPWCLPMMPAQFAAPSKRPYLSTIDLIQVSTSLRFEMSTSLIMNGAGGSREEKWLEVEEIAAGSTSAIQTVAPREERILEVER